VKQGESLSERGSVWCAGGTAGRGAPRARARTRRLARRPGSARSPAGREGGDGLEAFGALPAVGGPAPEASGPGWGRRGRALPSGWPRDSGSEDAVTERLRVAAGVLRRRAPPKRAAGEGGAGEGIPLSLALSSFSRAN